jgi:hypothetical protein
VTVEPASESCAGHSGSDAVELEPEDTDD